APPRLPRSARNRNSSAVRWCSSVFLKGSPSTVSWWRSCSSAEHEPRRRSRRGAPSRRFRDGRGWGGRCWRRNRGTRRGGVPARRRRSGDPDQERRRGVAAGAAPARRAPLGGDAIAQLEPLRQSLLGDASARAAELVAGARADAAATLANAEAAAASAIDQARGEGVRAAEATVQAQLIASRRAARTLVLDAQHDVDAAARVRAIASAMGFRERPEYQRLLDHP